MDLFGQLCTVELLQGFWQNLLCEECASRDGPIPVQVAFTNAYSKTLGQTAKRFSSLLAYHNGCYG